MSDEQPFYRITDVQQGYFNRAVWKAVYGRLANPTLQQEPTVAIENVVLQWQARLADLQAHDYAPLQKNKIYQYARNCPPVSTVTDRPLQPCQLRRTCPFCWGRQIVYKIWNRFYPELFPRGRTRSLPDLGVFYFRETSRHAGVPEALKWLRERPAGLPELDSSGSAIVQSCYPEDGQLAVRQVGLYLVDADTEIEEPEGYTVEGYREFDKAKATALVGSVCRFPVELFRCDPGLAVQVLQEFGRTKQCRMSGSLYKKRDPKKRNS